MRPGQLDGFVPDYIDSQGTGAVGASAVAKALGRSAGAVGNCLTRLAAAGRVRQVGDKARRYSSAAATSGNRRRSRNGDVMKVIGLGSPDDVRVRFDACEIDVLVGVLRDPRAKATRDAADTSAIDRASHRPSA